MINIIRMNNEIFTKTLEFLSSVPTIETIDENILNNACVAVTDDVMVGCISFEKYGNIGLIRYFVFKKALEIENLYKLLNELVLIAKDNNMKEFVCIAETEQIKDLFLSLGFKVLSNKKIFIDEDIIDNTVFKNSTFLNHVII